MPDHGATGTGGANGGGGGGGQQFSFTHRGQISIVSVPLHAGDYTIRLRATHTLNHRHSEVTLFVRVSASPVAAYAFAASSLEFVDNATLSLTPVVHRSAVTFALVSSPTSVSPFSIVDGSTLSPKATTLSGKYTVPIRAAIRVNGDAQIFVYADLSATITTSLRPNISPGLPDTEYVSTSERLPSGTYAGRVRAFSRHSATLAYYAGNCGQLAVDRRTGVLTTRVRFDRSTDSSSDVRCNLTVTAESRDGRLYRNYGRIRLYVTPDVNLQPRFAVAHGNGEQGYVFTAGRGLLGEVVGRVRIVSPHPLATPRYRLFSRDSAASLFSINSTSGVITRRLASAHSSRKRRSINSVSRQLNGQFSSPARSKRSASSDIVLHVIARVGTRETGVQVLIRSSSTTSDPNSTDSPRTAGKGFSGTPMVLLIVLLAVAIVACAVVIAVVVLRRRDRRRRKPHAPMDISATHDNHGLDLSSHTSLPPLPAVPKPHYGSSPAKGHHHHQPPIELPPYRQTLPEIPPESSGRGSAVDYDGDEVCFPISIPTATSIYLDY